MKWLEIPAHRVLEVERHELTNEFGIYDKAGEKLCYRGTPYLFFVRRTVSGSSAPSSLILKAQPDKFHLSAGGLKHHSSAIAEF